MLLIKTEIGKLALQNRDPTLSPKDRQLLILCNGSRSASSLCSLMGNDTVEALHRLMEAGFVKAVGSTSHVAAVVAKPERKPDPSKSGPRRSLAGTKMYIMDMLQLMRDMDASALSVSLHTSANEAEFIEHVIAGARLIYQRRGISYGNRVLEKLLEIAPHAHVPALQALSEEWVLAAAA